MPDFCTDPTCYAFGSYCRIPGHMKAAPAKERKEIPMRSEKMKTEMKGYKKEAKQFLKDNPQCQVTGCTKKSDNVHHKAGRIGKNLTDAGNWLAVCGTCHAKIEENPKWAKDSGYSVSRLKIDGNTKERYNRNMEKSLRQSRR